MTATPPEVPDDDVETDLPETGFQRHQFPARPARLRPRARRRLAALLAAGFSIPGGLLRAIGGWFSDKYGAHTVTWWVLWTGLVCLFFLSYPQTEFTILTVTGPKSFHVGLGPTVFTIIMFTMGIAFAIGKASVFKYIADDYSHNIGVVSGVVGLAGGMGGFFLPIIFGALVDLTGVRSSAFMLLFGIVWVSLMWMYFAEVRPMSAGRISRHPEAAPVHLN